MRYAAGFNIEAITISSFAARFFSASLVDVVATPSSLPFNVLNDCLILSGASLLSDSLISPLTFTALRIGVVVIDETLTISVPARRSIV